MQRGPYRAIRYSKAYDFSTLYAAARCWTVGADPYRTPNLKKQLVATGAPDSLVRQQDVNPCLYFLSAMPLVAAVAMLPWRIATVVWCLLCLVSFAASLLVIFRQTPLSFCSKWICCSLALLFCPVYVGLLYENPSVLACSLVALIVVSPWNYPVQGILLAIALCIKPQVALCAFCVLAIWKLWMPLAIGTGLSVLFAVIGVLRAASLTQLMIWWHSQQANFAINALPGGKSDPSPNSPWAFELLNGQTITALFVRDAHLRDLLLLALAAVLLALFLINRRAGRFDRNRDIVFFTAWTITTTYHRYYDAQLCLLLWPALIELWFGFHRRLAVGFAGCLCLLAVPSQGLLERLTHSQGAVHSVLDALLFRHQPAAVLLIALLAVFCWPAVRSTASLSMASLMSSK